ncbi:hypothetical protein BDZ89DRAFT_598843 [Hymenopellis radicata]|nr:hypothetical protein BDZ89DRAFT_598843 [Hymenopellis radicata]
MDDVHKDLQPTRRGCLKSPGHSKPPSPDPASTPPLLGSSDGTSRPCMPIRKSVSFCSEDAYDIWDADEWDRTPSEPARNLSYQDMLELKAIQRTLPRANQLPDMYTGRPGSHYLGKVPIGLLPLAVSGEERQYPPTNTPPSTPSPVQSGYSTPRKNFSFVPLLEPEPVYSHAARLKAVVSPMLAPPSPLVLDTSTPAADVLSAAKPIARKKNVMYINGEEVDLDEDEPSPVEPKKADVDPLMIACSFRAKRNTPTSSPPPIPTPPVVVPAQPKITTPEPPDPITLPACSFRARRVSPPIAQSPPATRYPPAPASPPSPRPTSPPSSRSPISRTPNPPRSPPTPARRMPWDSTVRTTRDNTNPSGMVGLGGHGWQSGRTSPVLRA